MKEILVIDITKHSDREITAAYKKLNNNSVTIDFICGDRQRLDKDYAGIIISVSATHIHEKKENPWISELESLLEKWLDKKIPVLGICFGYQLFGDTIGRKVTRNNIGRNMGRATITLGNHPKEHYIFKDLYADHNEIEVFCSHVYHVESAPTVNSYLKGTQIPMLEIYDSFIGVQFHPEFSTPKGLCILKNLVDMRRDLLIEDGKDPNKIILDLSKAEMRPQPHPSLKFLTNFVDHCLD